MCGLVSRRVPVQTHPDRDIERCLQRVGARHFTSASFDGCDYVLAMDRANRDELLRLARSDADRAKVRLFRSFDAAAPRDAEVPDPYYGGPRGFEEVFDLCEAACRGLVEHLRREHGL